MTAPKSNPQDVLVSLVTVVGTHNTPNLPIVVGEIVKRLDEGYTNFELIIVDNGLPQMALTRLTDLLAELPCIRLIRLSQNRDFDAAMFSGVDASIGDFVATFEIEADPLDSTFFVLDKAISGTEIVQGTVQEMRTPVRRRMGRWLFFRLSKTFAGIEVSQAATYLTAFSRSVCNVLTSSPVGRKYLRHLLRHIGFPVTDIVYTREANAIKRKSLGPSSAIEVLTSYSLRPLRAVSVIGLLAALLNLIYGTYVVTTFLFQPGVERGWASTNFQLSIMFFFLFLSLSLITEYLGRILSEAQRGSSYIVKEEFVSERLISNESRRNIG